MTNLAMKTIAIAVCAFLLSPRDSVRAQTNVNWANETVGDWNDDANWAGSIIPSREFDEIALIANGGTAFLDSPVVDTGVDTGVAGITITNGSLELRSGGILVSAPGFTAGNGGVVIGGTSAGHVTVFGGGNLAAESLSMTGPSESSLTLSGNGILNIAGSAALVRTTRIAGPSVAMTVGGNLTIGQDFIAEITSPSSHSAINVTGDVVLQENATLELDFSGGIVPTSGDSWTLISGANSITGNFSSVNGPELMEGLGYKLGTNAGDLTVSVGSILKLTVDRTTGAATISNLVGSVDLSLYAIGSPAGNLTPQTWDSFADSNFDDGGWLKGSPNGGNPQGLAEARLSGFSTLTAGQSESLGEVLNTIPLPFGQERTDLTFEYLEPGNRSFTSGVIEYTGAYNNLVLVVDPDTGEAAVQNQSPYDVDIRLYTITSESDALDPDPGATVGRGWDSLSETGADGGEWLRGVGSSSVLVEARTTGSLRINSGDILGLGAPFAVGSSQDLQFQFLLDGTSEPMQGVVEYGQIPTLTLSPGDFNGDGMVNIADYVVWRDNLGASDESALAAGSGNGGGIDNTDYALWKSNFGNAAIGTAVAATVPEPGSAAVLLVACLLACHRLRGITRFSLGVRGV